MSRQLLSRRTCFLRQGLSSPASFSSGPWASIVSLIPGHQISTRELAPPSFCSCRENSFGLPVRWLSPAPGKLQAPLPPGQYQKPNSESESLKTGSNAKLKTILLVPSEKENGNSIATDCPTAFVSKTVQPLCPFPQCQPRLHWTSITFSRALHSAIGDDDDEDESDDHDDFRLDSDRPKGKGRSLVSGADRGLRASPKLSESEDNDEVPTFTTKKRKPSAIAACEESDSDDNELFAIDSSKKRKSIFINTLEDSDDDGDGGPASRTKSSATFNGNLRRSSSVASGAESRTRFTKKRPVALEISSEERASGVGKERADSTLVTESHGDEEPENLRQSDQSLDLNSVSEEGALGPSYLTNTRFDKFPISPLSIKALHSVLKYERMTEVQEATFPVILKGQDVLAKARTGTGKTIAFLLPAIEAILKAPAARARNPIYVLIVCPTRELAQQAAAEAKVLLQFHRGLGAQVVYGGCSIRGEQMNLSRSPCQILVGTPGRLVDHIQRTPEMARQLKCVQLFVLDEADHMLDMGFRDSLQKIMEAIPSKRQTLLFSATIPKEVHSMARIALKNDHIFIDAVGKDSQDTHMKVKQQYIVVPQEKQIRVLYAFLQQHMEAEPHYKVLVFCSTARTTGFMCKLFMNLGFNAREIHSRKDQSYRTRVSDEFRHSKGGIVLFTSDVSARGVDYPNVTLVVQVGAPSEFEQYIHRLGRTGRAGKKGEGLLILAPWEEYFLQKLAKLPVASLSPPKLTSQAKSKILSAASLVDESLKEMAYTAWLGYYRSLKGIALDKAMLVEYANQFSVSMGLEEPPALSRMVVSKMALNGVPGIRLRR